MIHIGIIVHAYYLYNIVSGVICFAGYKVYLDKMFSSQKNTFRRNSHIAAINDRPYA